MHFTLCFVFFLLRLRWKKLSNYSFILNFLSSVFGRFSFFLACPCSRVVSCNISLFLYSLFPKARERFFRNRSELLSSFFSFHKSVWFSSTLEISRLLNHMFSVLVWYHTSLIPESKWVGRVGIRTFRLFTQFTVKTWIWALCSDNLRKSVFVSIPLGISRKRIKRCVSSNCACYFVLFLSSYIVLLANTKIVKSVSTVAVVSSDLKLSSQTKR